MEGILPPARQGEIAGRLVNYCLPATPPADGAPTPDAKTMDGSTPAPDSTGADGVIPMADGPKPAIDSNPLELVLYGGSGCSAVGAGEGAGSGSLVLLLLVAGAFLPTRRLARSLLRSLRQRVES